MIIFKTIRIEGFGSFQSPTTFNFGHGLNLVKGKNGHGKTTLFSALFWVLYQENLKGVNNANVVTKEKMRTRDYRGCRVVLDFEITGSGKLNGDYRLARHVNFSGTTSGYKGGSSLLLFKDKDLMNEKLHKGDVQSKVMELLGMNSKIFLNSVLFGQRMVRLIQSKETEKRELFEELFEVAFIPAAKEKAKTHSESLQAKISGIETNITANDREIENLERTITEKETTLQEWQESHDKRILTIQGKIDKATEDITAEKTKLAELDKKLKAKKPNSLTAELKAVELATTVFDNIKSSSKKLGQKVSDCDDEYNRSMKKVTQLENDINNVKSECPTCKQPLPKDKVDGVIKELKNSLSLEKKVCVQMLQDKGEAETKLRQVDKELKEATVKLEAAENAYDLKKKAAPGDTLDSDIAVCNSRLEQFEENLANAKIDMASEKRAEKPKYKLDVDKKRVSDLKEDTKAMQEQKEKHVENKSHYDWWNTKGFNSGGLKAFVFDSMLNRLNDSIAKYAARLGVLVRFSVDLTKASKPFKTEVLVDGEEEDYQQLSGGEKQRIDICLAFAMFDIIGLNNATNLMILDEVLEGLDDAGIEQVFDMLREKSGPGMAIYLITHQNSIDTHAAREVLVDKDEVSSYIEY